MEKFCDTNHHNGGRNCHICQFVPPSPTDSICEPGDFLCESGFGCLGDETVCDGTALCLDASDEQCGR